VLILYLVYKCAPATPFSVVDSDNPYKDIIILVNGEERKREDELQLVEGDNVNIVAVSNIGNIVGSPTCTADGRFTCTSNFLCNAIRYFEYSFSPVTLAHNGIVVTFRTSDGTILGGVTLHGKYFYCILLSGMVMYQYYSKAEETNTYTTTIISHCDTVYFTNSICPCVTCGSIIH